MKYQELIEQILINVGGKENIGGVTHCITRLRFKLKDESKANTETIKKIKGVVTVVQSGGQYQVVIGNHVPEVYKEFMQHAGLDSSNEETGDAPKGLLNKFIDIVSGIFTPVLGLLAATGMIKGINVLLVSFGLIERTSGTYAILQAAGDCFFYFFPIFLGYTAAKKFGLTQFVGMALGAALVYPAIGTLSVGTEPLYFLFQGTIFESPVYVTFLGIPVILMSYSSSVIPIIISTFFGAKLEKILMKTVPSLLKSFLVPLLTVMIMVPLTFIVIGPVATWLGDILGAVALGAYNLSPIIAGMVIGGLWQVLVMFGLHWGLIPIAINNISVLGYDSVMVLGMATPFATAGAVLGVIIRSKSSDVRVLGIPAFISSLFGISEPSLYGITLPRKKPFYATLFASSVGGMIMGSLGTTSYIMGGMGIFGIPNYISPENGMDKAFFGYLIAIAVAFAISFILTMTIAYDPSYDKENPDTEKETNKGILLETIGFSAPIKGEIIPLSEIKDTAFSEGLLGKGAAILPDEGKVYAVEDGIVETLFPTNHAIGLKYDNGIEMLIHIGMDTVNLKGQYFEPRVVQGERVKKGQLLLEFDLEELEKRGYNLETPVVITNSAEYLDIVPNTDKENNPLIMFSVVV